MIIIQNHHQEESEWLSVSDLMSGLMIIFLFIAVIYMRNIMDASKRFESVNSLIVEKLEEEFHDDWESWGVDFDHETITISFKNPSIFFDTGSYELKDNFKGILDNFFPRYLKVLYMFKNHINEIRIEGHTSSIWKEAESELDAYIKNMELSQNRTRNVLDYLLQNSKINRYRNWSQYLITANGLSSSKSIVVNGVEDFHQSQRVDFRVVANTADELIKTLKKLSKNEN